MLLFCSIQRGNDIESDSGSMEDDSQTLLATAGDVEVEKTMASSVDDNSEGEDSDEEDGDGEDKDSGDESLTQRLVTC